MESIKKLGLNSMMSILNSIILFISSLIVPRLILTYYGSEINGLVASINQFLSFITFLDLGVGAVVQSALYEPLAKNDNRGISKVLLAAKKYFQKIAYILIIYVTSLIFVYPLMIDQTTDFLSTAFLIFSISISLFGQYYFGITNEFLLNADQKAYIQLGTEIIVVILNVISTIVLITNGFSIQIVILISSLVYLLRPMFLLFYVNRSYSILYEVSITRDPIPQRWSGMGQHIAFTIQNSVDVLVLTVFSSLENVSIYSVYNIFIQGIKLLVSSISNELKPFFGTLFAKNEIDLLNRYFDRIEWIFHNGVVYLFSLMAVLINPMVQLYTIGIEDADYNQPIFSFLLIISQLIFSIRSPYQSMILAAGHFKETQRSSFIEAIINIISSIILVNYFGLLGVVLGTIFSMVYRTLYLIIYLSKNILNRGFMSFFKNFIVDIILFISLFTIGNYTINKYEIASVSNLLSIGVALAIIFIIILGFINLIMNYIFKTLNKLNIQ